MENGVTAKWHDESHLNKYILNKNPLVLDPIYMWPTEFKYSLEHKKNKKEAKAILRNKNDYGGHAYLRGEK